MELDEQDEDAGAAFRVDDMHGRADMCESARADRPGGCTRGMREEREKGG
jgi:hypothetical protein